jgi:hypothetical protein
MWDIVDDVQEVKTYNTRSKGKVPPDKPSSSKLPSKKDQPTPTPKKNSLKKDDTPSCFGPIEYSLVENLKNTNANISLFELLKFFPVKNNLFKSTRKSVGQVLGIATSS